MKAEIKLIEVENINRQYSYTTGLVQALFYVLFPY